MLKLKNTVYGKMTIETFDTQEKCDKVFSTRCVSNNKTGWVQVSPKQDTYKIPTEIKDFFEDT